MFAKWQEDTQPQVMLAYLCLADCCRYTNFVISRFCVAFLVSFRFGLLLLPRFSCVAQQYRLFLWNIFTKFILSVLRCTDFMQFSFRFSFQFYSLHKHKRMTFISNSTFYFVSNEFSDTKSTLEKVMNKCHCHSRLKSFIMLVVGVRIPKHSHPHNPPAVNARILNHHNLQQPMAHTRIKPKKTIW